MKPKILLHFALLTIGLGLLPCQAQVTSGLQLWLKPEGLTNSAALSKVAFWTNSLGIGYDARNSILANQPYFLPQGLNGYPVVRFLDDGSNLTGNPNLTWLESSLPLSANSNAFTAIVVCESQTAGVRDTVLQQLGSGTTLLYFETNATPESPAIVGFASGQIAQGPYRYPVRNWVILVLVQDPVAKTQQIYQNGFLLVSTNIGTSTALANAGWLLGCNKAKATHGLNGDIAEVMIYDKALSAAEINDSSYYLAQKFGFAVLTDNFDTADTWNLNDNLAARQSGCAAPADYWWEGAEISGNQLKISLPLGGSGFVTDSVTPKVNFYTNESGSFSISYDITSYTSSGGIYDGWAGFVMRSQNDLQPPVGDPNSFASILFYNGGWQDFVSGNVVAGGNPTPTIPPPYHIDILVNNNVVTHLMNRTNVLAVTPLPCASANKITFTLGSGQLGLPATMMIDNFSFTTTPVAPEIAPAWPATTRLADSFAVPNTTNLDQDLATRQTGTAKPVGYFTAAALSSIAISEGAAVITNEPSATEGGVGMFSPNVDFRQLERLNSFRFRFTASGGNPTAPNNSWLGVRFRDTGPTRFVASSSGGGNALNLFPDGRWYLFQTNNVVGMGTVPVSPSYVFEIEVRSNILRMSINGKPLSLGCGTEAYILPANQAGNFITLQALGAPGTPYAYAIFDDLVFEALDPGVAVTAPSIVNPVYIADGTNSHAKFSFASVDGFYYAIDTKTDLLAPQWNFIGGQLGTGSLVTFTNQFATNVAQFYRVRIP